MSTDPTSLHCPALPEGDNSTHHLVPSQARESEMRCRYCGQTEQAIRDEVTA